MVASSLDKIPANARVTIWGTLNGAGDGQSHRLHSTARRSNSGISEMAADVPDQAYQVSRQVNSLCEVLANRMKSIFSRVSSAEVALSQI